jgi:cysteine-rich repeat protein
MGNTIIPARILAPLSLTLVLAAGAMNAHAAEIPEIRCRAGIEKGLHAFVSKSLKARLQCQADILDGYEHPAANCLSGSGSVLLPGRLYRARVKLLSRIVSSCKGAKLNLLSYPGPCPAGTSFDEQNLLQCIDSISKDVSSALFEIWYPSELEPARGPVTECIKGVARRASAMLLQELRVRLDCLEKNERPDLDTGVDCRGQLPPYGQGTLDARVDEKIIRAHDAWLSSFPPSCVADFPTIGFGEECSVPEGQTVGIPQFHACVFRANRASAPLLVDLAFPSAPVCGNGIEQEGEACDDGTGNSDTTPDACRTDCTLPFCGDGTADPRNDEECDDGDDQELDGCRPDCTLEFCGDGDVNDLPNEDCDDGNGDAGDRCTNDCRDATCGDGVVCDDEACTSGPEGGPELCDNGSENAPGALCDVDCSGFTRSCTLRIGVTNAVNLGSITYEFVYANADGELAGLGSAVQCTSPVTGGLASFFDNDGTRRMRESVIVDDGLATPAALANCTFLTNDASLVAGDFSFNVISATDTDFEPVTATLGITSLVCVMP